MCGRSSLRNGGAELALVDYRFSRCVPQAAHLLNFFGQGRGRRAFGAGRVGYTKWRMWGSRRCFSCSPDRLPLVGTAALQLRADRVRPPGAAGAHRRDRRVRPPRPTPVRLRRPRRNQAQRPLGLCLRPGRLGRAAAPRRRPARARRPHDGFRLRAPPADRVRRTSIELLQRRVGVCNRSRPLDAAGRFRACSEHPLRAFRRSPTRGATAW